MNDSILKQLNELESLANRYQEELGLLRIEIETQSHRAIAYRVLSLLSAVNQITPKLIAIQNQINHEKNNHNPNDLRSHPYQGNGEKMVGSQPE